MRDLHDAPQEPKSKDPTISFEKLAVLVTATAPLSIILSFFYDWGFFWELGISFAEAPTTIIDYMQTWLIWLPWIATTAIIVLALDFGMRRLGLPAKEESTFKFARPLRTIVVISWLFLVQTTLPNFKFIVLAFLWILFAEFIFTSEEMKTQYSHSFQSYFSSIPATMLAFFFLGQLTADPGFSRVLPTYHLYVEAGPHTSQPEQIKLLRSFENWLLVRNQSENLTWIRMDDIKRMTLADRREVRYK